DSVGAQSGDDRIHLAAKQNKITSDCRAPRAGRLKVDCSCQSHGRRNWFGAMGQLTCRNFLRARHTKLIHAAVDLSGATNDLIELLSIEIDLLGLLNWRWSRQRRLAQRES